MKWDNKEGYTGSTSTKGFDRLTSRDRQIIEERLNSKVKIIDICRELRISRSTLFYERMRMGSLKVKYSAEYAQKDSDERKKFNNDTPIKQLSNDHYFKRMNEIHKLLTNVKDEKMPKSVKDAIIASVDLLEKMGVNPTKFRTILSEEEKRKILELKQQGRSGKAICKIMNRSEETVYKWLRKLTEEQLTKHNPEEVYYESLKSKWLS